MNIQLITPRFGGPYNWGRQLAIALQERGFGVRLVSETLPLLMTPLRPWGDITHAAVPLPWQWGSSPMVLTVKGDYQEENNIWKYLYPRSIRRAQVVTVPSKFLQNKLGLDQAAVIPNAIHLDEYPVREERKRNQKIRILIATKFYFPEKVEGIFRLLGMLHDLQGDVLDNITIDVIGEGPLLPRLRERSKKFGLPIVFHGYQKTKDFLYQADIFLYYSLHDNMPNVILEAMAAGLPVVSNDIGAVREMIVDGVSGFISDDATYLSTVLRLFQSDELRLNIGQAARVNIQKNFNWDHVIEQYIDIYHSLQKS